MARSVLYKGGKGWLMSDIPPPGSKRERESAGAVMPGKWNEVQRMRRRGWVTIDQERCTGCGRCVVVCPVGGIEASGLTNAGGYPTVHFVGDACRADRFCLRACPEAGTIQVYHGDPATHA